MNQPIRIGVMTSGGDAPGMNSAVRAVVRSAIHAGAEIFAIHEGWRGAVEGGEGISQLTWADVGSILHLGGTVIGTARCDEFRSREGRLRAAINLVKHDIDRLIIIGGDGSLTGADTLRTEWDGLLREAVETGELTSEQAKQHQHLIIAGLVGSIDNDMVGTDMTIGTDSALHRITKALDAISSTAASHQRTFIVEVMGRHCGYLALMGAIAGGADYVIVPETPPADGWEDRMCDILRRSREAGSRDSIVIVAEGALSRAGEPINPEVVRTAITERLGEDARITILGHVQRGGTPSAYDRWMATLLGVSAVEEVLSATSDREPQLIGVRNNRVHYEPLMGAVANTKAVSTYIQAGDYQKAIDARGSGFSEMVHIYRALSQARPGQDSITDEVPGKATARIAVMHVGGLAPGMNPVVRAAVRLGIDRGHTMLGITGGFPGLLAGDVRELSWRDVEGWHASAGADLGTRRTLPETGELYSVARHLEEQRVDALLIVGGFHALTAMQMLTAERVRFPAFDIPIAFLPASIDNNLPGSQMSVGADTALNEVVCGIDKLRQSAAATHRAFLVETMGRKCGFLAFLGGFATGAERIYLHETGMTLPQLSADVQEMVAGFKAGRKFYLAVRNEDASEHYTLDVLRELFAAESQGLFTVRSATLGHVCQGAVPSPFDRVNAARLAFHGIAHLSDQLAEGRADYVIAAQDQGTKMMDFRLVDSYVDWSARRPHEQWWLQLRQTLTQMSRPPQATE